MQSLYDNIELLLHQGDIAMALRLADEALGLAPDAKLYFLQGKAYMKSGRPGEAMSAFMKSRQLDPDGPAAETYVLAGDIMSFYHKDLYNP